MTFSSQDSLQSILADTLSLVEDIPSLTVFLVEESHIKTIKKPIETKTKSLAITNSIQTISPAKKAKETPQTPPEIEEFKQAPIREIQAPLLAFEELSEKLSSLFPHFPINSEPLNDKKASYKANPSYLKALQAQVIILSFKESKTSDLFLQNIQKALSSYHIDTVLLPVKDLEETKQFLKQAQAKVVLCSHYIFKLPPLLSLITELPATQKRQIGASHLFLLERFEQYFSDKNLKQSLWQSLCKILTQN